MRIRGPAACPRLLAGLLAGAAMSAATAMIPVDLRCDGIAAPLAASAAPRFLWRVESDERGQAQTAWQILVASRADLLDEDQADLWDSGKTPAAREPLVTYSGKPLSPGGRYHWKVRCWDAGDKPSAWSAPSFMEIAPQAPADWHGAKWIDDGRENPAEPAGFYQEDPAPLLRREFEISKPVARARLHLAGLGYALASLNGTRLADQALDPPWTAFDQRILFRTHDVTGQLGEGANCLGLTLGNGWYNLLPLQMWGHRVFRESAASGRPRVIALLDVEHPDGTRTRVTTGDEWTVAAGPSVRNSLFLGEERDARLAQAAWDNPRFDAAKWRPARVTDAPLEPLRPLLDMPPVRAVRTFPAVAVTTPSPDVHIVDFGVNFTGVPEIDLNLPAGTRVAMRYGELLHDDGTLNPLTSVAGQIKGMRKDEAGVESPMGGPGAPAVAWQQDVYIARGGGPEIYRPDFTFHAFRYMEITGLPAAPKPSDIRGVVLHSDLPDAGTFSCSNELFNRIQEITRRTFLNNAVSVQSDCPHRERLAYGGDIVATSDAWLMNFDMAGFYAKTVRDWADAARPDGNFTDTAPFVGIQYCGVGWAMVHPLLLEQLHQHYGNRGLIEEQLPAAMRWFDLEASKREKNGLVMSGLGDHESLRKIAGAPVTTMMFIDTARRMARLCRVIGRENDAARYDRMAAESTAAWEKVFHDAETGRVYDGSQSCQVMALGFGAVRGKAGDAVFENLVANLTAPSDGPSLTTGIFGTRFLLEELPRRGRQDLAYALVNRRTFPSWGWMIGNGATTLWEDWKGGADAKSHNHPMFGSVSGWFFRHLGGIQPAEDAIGFDRIVIRPQVPAGLEWVKTSHDSIRGRIESNWKTTDKGREFEIVIPPDATAHIILPAELGENITESGLPLTHSRGMTVLPPHPDSRHVKAGSGHYRFLVEP
jgi:alpha-L-rhamnosidase